MFEYEGLTGRISLRSGPHVIFPGHWGDQEGLVQKHNFTLMIFIDKDKDIDLSTKECETIFRTMGGILKIEERNGKNTEINYFKVTSLCHIHSTNPHCFSWGIWATPATEMDLIRRDLAAIMKG